MYDVVIIGGGPAGLTASIYCSRRGLKVLVVTKDIGGQVTRTNEIENYPGFDHITGTELAKKLFDQAKKFGSEIIFDEAKSIAKKRKGFSVQTLRRKVDTKTIILAFGKKPRELGVPGEEELKGRGVSYCATCDAPFFKDKTVTVIGGGNSAIDAALIASAVAKKVYLVHRGAEFRAEDVLVQKVKDDKKIETIMNDEVAELKGTSKLEKVVLKSSRELDSDGIIVEVGFIIDRSLVQGLIKMDENNQVITNTQQETSVKGIFAAGDLTQTPFKQIIVSAGEGAKAALSCFDFIQKQEGKKGLYADWH